MVWWWCVEAGEEEDEACSVLGVGCLRVKCEVETFTRGQRAAFERSTHDAALERTMFVNNAKPNTKLLSCRVYRCHKQPAVLKTQQKSTSQ